MVASTPFSKDDDIPLANATQFKTVVGALQYCTLTRLEITFFNKQTLSILAPTY